jgi:hypothetical protein
MPSKGLTAVAAEWEPCSLAIANRFVQLSRYSALRKTRKMRPLVSTTGLSLCPILKLRTSDQSFGVSDTEVNFMLESRMNGQSVHPMLIMYYDD